jgi:aconitate hydratase 2/2-methylisocitrate dehydratase
MWGGWDGCVLGLTGRLGVWWQSKAGNKYAKEVMQSWADAEWFTSRPKVAEKITTTVFFVKGETNTDDLSPAPDAWSRPDIPLHGLAMLKMAREGIVPDKDGEVGPIKQMEELKKKGFPLAYVGDVVGTGSSRKSATNSILWFMGDDIPCVPNKRAGGICLGSKIAPIFFNTMEDAGALPIELDVSKMKTGDIIDIYPYEGVAKNHTTGEVIARSPSFGQNFSKPPGIFEFTCFTGTKMQMLTQLEEQELCKFALKTPVIFDEVQAGGRIPLIIGRGTHFACFTGTNAQIPTQLEEQG